MFMLPSHGIRSELNRKKEKERVKAERMDNKVIKNV